jgi:hypothetical protein
MTGTNRRVGIDARAIAAGPIDGNKENVRVSLVLSPVEGDHAGLEAWPSQIEDLITGNKLRVDFYPVVVPTNKRPQPDKGAKLSLQVVPHHTANIPGAPLLVRAKILGKEISGSIVDQWKAIVQAGVANPSAAWSALKNISSEKVVEKPYLDTSDAAKSVPHVLPTGRVDGALVEIVERAERLMDRFRECVDPCRFGAAGRSQENKPSAVKIETPEERVARHKLALEEFCKSLRIRVEDLPEQKLKEWQQSQLEKDTKASKDALAKVADEQTKVDIAEVKKCIEQAGKIAVKQKEYLQPVSLNDATGRLKTLAAEMSCGCSFSDIFNQDTRSAVKNRSGALHRLSTLPDAQGVSQTPKGALPKRETDRLRKMAAKEAELRGEGLSGEKLEAALNEAFPPPTEVHDGDVDRHVRTVLFALRSYPTLGRLFRFVVDVEVPAAALTAVKSNHGFLFLGVSLQSGAAVAEISAYRTLAKVEGIGSESVSFWPATREELELREYGSTDDAVHQSGAVSQLNGVVNLGQCACDSKPACPSGSVRSGRYELVTVNTVSAAEGANVERARAQEAANAAAAAGIPGTDTTSSTPFAGQSLTRLATGGIGIVDRWRAGAVAAEIAAAEAFPTVSDELKFLDAEDLTMGYRVDVTIPLPENEATNAAQAGPKKDRRWRSLMEREIDFRAPKESDDAHLAKHATRSQHKHSVDKYKEWLDKLGLKYETGPRRELDNAIVNPASRRRMMGKNEHETVKQMVHAEEVLVSWEGDPLGLSCSSSPPVKILPGTEVAVSRFFHLPESFDEAEASRKPWPLRYGWAYRFGMRPVWAGGVSLSLDQANAVYKSKSKEKKMTLPQSSADVTHRFRRFLRHEPLLPPVLLLPKGAATQDTNFLRQTAAQVTLRTSEYASEKERNTEASSWRMILPPGVSLDELVRHGSVDEGGVEGNTAMNSLRALGIDHDSPEGFPVYGPDPKKRFPTSLQEVSKGIERDKDRENRQGEQVFRLRAGAADLSREKYYPDPLADRLVIAVRPAKSKPGTAYFNDPISISVGRSGKRKGFYDVLPVAVSFKKAHGVRPSQEKKKLSTRDLLAKRYQEHIDRNEKLPAEHKKPWITGHVRDSATLNDSGGVQAYLVEFELYKGEAIEVDCWFAPSKESLERYFDLPETIAAAVSEITATPELAGSELQKTYALFFGIADLNSLLSQPGDESWVGIGGTRVWKSVVKKAAEKIASKLLIKPLAEISAVRTISATHAVDRPARAPAFAKNGAPDIRAYRVRADREAKIEKIKHLRELYKARKSAAEQPGKLAEIEAKLKELAYGEPGDTGVIFAGEVFFDRESSRQLELRASYISPETEALDSALRRRTPEERLKGEWPVLNEVRRNPFEKNSELKKDAPTYSEKLFGFSVFESGRIEMKTAQPVTLRTFDDLEASDESSEFAGLDPIDLLAEQLRTLERGDAQEEPNKNIATAIEGRKARSLIADPINDSISRSLKLHLRATTRFDAHFLRVIPTPSKSVEEIYYPDENNDLSGKPYSATQLTQESDGKNGTVHVAIPATRRPSKPQIHSVLPTFRTVVSDEVPGASNPKRTLKRISGLRILLDRPWFSSGEGERLGLILWPPKLEMGTSFENHVPRDALSDRDLRTKSPEQMDLTNFLDEDLGAGGKYVTRWGADPIRLGQPVEFDPGSQDPLLREANGPVGNFLFASSFADLSANTPFDRCYVPFERVPIAIESNGVGSAAKDQTSRSGVSVPGEILHAGLLTFTPAFDAESEKWYVDLEFNNDDLKKWVEPFIRLGIVRYQENAHPDLRVSEPVVAWAQIMPDRSVTVEMHGGDLCVNVNGPAYDKGPSNIGNQADLTDTCGNSEILISVSEVAKTASGLASERTFAEAKGAYYEGFISRFTLFSPGWRENIGPFNKRPRPVFGKRSKRESVSLVNVAPDSSRGAKRNLRSVVVTVEEVENFLSTANAFPPAAPPAGGLDAQAILKPEKFLTPILSTGPKFLARIEYEAGDGT